MRHFPPCGKRNSLPGVHRQVLLWLFQDLVLWLLHTQQVESFRFYQRIGWNDTMPLLSPVRKLARWRCQNHYYGLPLEKRLYEWLRPPEKLS